MSPDFVVNRFSATNGRIDGATATFGAPFYGERLLGKLVYGEPKTKQNHCTKEDYDVPEPDRKEVSNHEHTRMRLLHIIVVRQGGCSFVTKARVAQEKGAHAVIVVSEDATRTPADIKDVVVGDDGNGKNVDIPTLLISNEEGSQLIEAVKEPEPVVVELAWDVPSDHVVLVDMWMSSGSQQSNLFLQSFAPHRRALKDAIKFVPHFHVFGLSGASYDYNDLCTDSTATSCAEDPDGAGPITGRMVIEEDLRQLCIHAIYKVRKPSGSSSSKHAAEYAKQYWDYMERFHGQCSTTVFDNDPTRRFGEACSKDLMKKVGIDTTLVEQCVQQQGEEKLKEQRIDVAWSPRALRINGWRFRGALEADLVTRAICAGFVHQPPACKQLVEPISPFKVPKPSSSPSGMSWRTLCISMLVVVGGVVVAGLLYKRSLTRHIQSALREEVMLEVQSQMDAYKELSS